MDGHQQGKTSKCLTLYCMNFVILAEITCYELVTLCNRELKIPLTFLKWWSSFLLNAFTNPTATISPSNLFHSSQTWFANLNRSTSSLYLLLNSLKLCLLLPSPLTTWKNQLDGWGGPSSAIKFWFSTKSQSNRNIFGPETGLYPVRRLC